MVAGQPPAYKIDENGAWCAPYGPLVARASCPRLEGGTPSTLQNHAYMQWPGRTAALTSGGLSSNNNLDVPILVTPGPAFAGHVLGLMGGALGGTAKLV